jgi:hypothetical protein
MASRRMENWGMIREVCDDDNDDVCCELLWLNVLV